MAQTPDGYLWLGCEFGLFRFDGVHPVQWQPPAGQRLPEKTLPSARHARRHPLDWHVCRSCHLEGRQVDSYPEVGRNFVTSLFEDRDGTVWVGILEHAAIPGGRLCAIRNGRAQCLREDGSLGRFVWTLSQDSSGALWAGAESGLWRSSLAPLSGFPRRPRSVT